MLDMMKAMSLSWALVAGALMVAACTTGAPVRSNQSQSQPTPQPPASVPMESSRALGLWLSNFGAVKIEPDDSPGNDKMMGVWVYDRSGTEVVGFFSGALDGNVLRFRWHEPAAPQALTGGGYVAFEPQGSRFSGRWWTDDQSRTGLFTGWRSENAGPVNPTDGSADGSYGGNSYGGSSYGGSAVQPGAAPY
jgi:hypothetical protein